MEIELKQFSKDNELEAQRKLFIECFPENIGTPVETTEHYLWKFHSSTVSPPSHEYVAYLENDMIGYYAAIPYRYNFFSQEFKVAMVCDVMTGVKARGKGVFAKLGEYSNREFQKKGLIFSTGYPIRAEVLPGHLKVGWKVLFDLPLYTRFLKFNSFLKSKNKSYLIPFLNTPAFIYNLLLKFIPFSKKDITISGYSSKNGIPSISGLLDFLNEWQKNIPISLIKDSAFMNWRIGAPNKDYHLTVVKYKNKIVGYSLYRFVIKEKVPSIGILDMCLNKNYYHLSRFLINDIVKYAKSQKAEFIFMMMSEFWAKNYNIWKCGFLQTKFKFHFILKDLNIPENENRHTDVKNWHLMWIDSDDL